MIREAKLLNLVSKFDSVDYSLESSRKVEKVEKKTFLTIYFELAVLLRGKGIGRWFNQDQFIKVLREHITV
jgi:hypothetical protein